MNVLAEISDYQVAAKLINLPTTIFTDSYAYINPGAYMAYKIQKEIDADITTRIIGHTEATPTNTAYPIESLVENLGHIQCYSISDGDVQCKILMPTVMLYDFCSPELKFMNCMEFECLVHVANKRDHCESTRNKQFELSPNSGIASSKALFFFQQNNAFHYLPITYHHILDQDPQTKLAQNLSYGKKKQTDMLATY